MGEVVVENTRWLSDWDWYFARSCGFTSFLVSLVVCIIKKGHTSGHEHANDPLDLLYFDLQRLVLLCGQLGHLDDVPGQTGISPRFVWLIHPCQQLGACQQGRYELGIVVCFVRCGCCLFHERFGFRGRFGRGDGGLKRVVGRALESECDLGLGRLARFKHQTDIQLKDALGVGVFFTVG